MNQKFCSNDLTVADYERIFRVLERVHESATVADFKANVMDSLGREFNLRHTTCFTGTSYGSLFRDPDPLLLGRTVSMFREYRSAWSESDAFRLQEARVRLEQTSAVAVSELSAIPRESRNYLDDFLGRRGIAGVGSLYIQHSGGHSLVGLFTETHDIPQRDMVTLRLLGRQLSAFGKNLPKVQDGARTERLSRRQKEVGKLVTEGLTNAEIAAILVIAEDTVKKHVSQVLATTGCRSRTELALYLR